MAFHSKCSFQIGDEVEVCCNSEGFLGSYWEAIIVANMGTNYLVEYKDFVDEADESTPLRETVMAKHVRPVPPQSPLIGPSRVSSLEGSTVDAFINDGWWVGTICGKKDSDHFFVFFETTGKQNAYPLSKLRFHMEWLDGEWVPSNKRCTPVASKQMFAPVSSEERRELLDS